ncbi:MAG: SDR family NAD(P)-dependent oxidoreductase [Polyangiaceae bacterium]
MSAHESGSSPLRFTAEDLDRFASCTGDRSPLSMNEEYARRTPYGERVVFGVLVVLRALAAVAPEGAYRVASLKVRFQRPLHPGRDYQLHCKKTANGGVDARVLGASGALYTRIQARFQAIAEAPALREVESSPGPATPATAYEDRAISDLRFALSADRLGPLVDLCGPALAFTPDVAPLIWGSVFVGMTAPGESAYLASLELTARFDAESRNEVTWSSVSVETDDRFRMATITAVSPACELSLQAVSRPPPVALTWTDATAAAIPEDARSKRILVTGAARGFGLALTLAASRSGMSAIGAVRKRTDSLAEMERAAAADACALAFHEADLSDPEKTSALAGLSGPAIDVLVLSASPPIQEIPLLDQPPGYASSFVQRSVDLTMSPLLALLPSMPVGATIVFVSSAFVTSPPKNLAHYVAAKTAIESLLRGLAAEHPSHRFVIARPGKMLTDQTNGTNPQGIALPSPFDVARRLLEAAFAPGETGNLITLDDL